MTTALATTDVLTEARVAGASPSSASPWPTELFVLCGEARPDLRRKAASLADYLERTPEVCLQDLGYTLNTTLAPGGSRLALVAGSAADLKTRLGRAAERLADPGCRQIQDSLGIYWFERPLYPEGRVALLFPGEGAQYLNMLKDLQAGFPEVREPFDEADRLALRAGRPERTLSRLLFLADDAGAEERERAEGELRKLGNAMFSVLFADLAVLALLRRLALPFHAVAGHSMGELAALIAAQCVDIHGMALEQVIGTMEALQQEEEAGRVDEAILLAVGAGRSVIAEVTAGTAGDSVYLAMDNCPHQTVVVGPPGPMAAVEAKLQARGVLCERLPFGRPYHTPLFEPRLALLDRMFDGAGFRAPRTPVYSCTTARPFPSDPAAIRRLAVAHWASPVEFTRLIENLYADGIRLFVEAGPRGNLSAFVADVLRGRPFAALPADLPRRAGLTQLNHLAGQLVAHHVPIDLAPLYAHRQPRRVTWDVPSEGQGPSSENGPTGRPSARGVVMSQYLDVMENFLGVQRDVMEQFLRRRTGSTHGANGTGRRPQVSLSAARPLVGAIVQHEPGRVLVMRRRLDLAEDLFAADHTVGGRTVSKVDPNQHGLPVMPMTFSLEMMAEVASLLIPGKVIVGFERIRLLRWLPFDDEDATTVEVTARVAGHDGRGAEGVEPVEVEIRDLGTARRPADARSVAVQGTVRLADRYPEPPAPGEFPLTDDRPCRISLEVLYKNLFHGPLFQGVRSLERVGNEGIEARIEALPPSGLFRSTPEPELLTDPVLIDVAMHPLAAWHLEQPDQAGRILLPFELGRLELYGPRPPAGASFGARGRMEDFSARHFSHGVDVLDQDGRLWCRLSAARYWRFYVPFGDVNFHGPKDEYFVSRPWREAQERLAAGRQVSLIRLEPPADIQQPVLRLATARVTLSPGELPAFRRLSASEREINEWLFGRMAAKDAVRTLWWERHGERLFPADIEIDLVPPCGMTPRRRGTPGPAGFPAVAVVHCGGLAFGVAAFVRRVGLAVERLGSADAEFRHFPEMAGDRPFLERFPDPAEGAARLRCARRAAAQALGGPVTEDAAGLTLRHADPATGLAEIAGGECVVPVTTARDGDWVVAAAFCEDEAV